MVIFRAAAYILLIAGFILLVLDGMRSIAADALVFTPLGQVWFNLNPDSLAAFQAWSAAAPLKSLIHPVAEQALYAPGWLLPLVLSFLLALIGRQRSHERQWIGEVE
ncbi:MAG: hypothetical protein C0605_03030 [Hyphomicrobiales bacterium]|nr:MAG: hypothetical protein C0605_03030 [Hyphomicrobiales bacterium]